MVFCAPVRWNLPRILTTILYLQYSFQHTLYFRATEERERLRRKPLVLAAYLIFLLVAGTPAPAPALPPYTHQMLLLLPSPSKSLHLPVCAFVRIWTEPQRRWWWEHRQGESGGRSGHCKKWQFCTLCVLCCEMS